MPCGPAFGAIAAEPPFKWRVTAADVASAGYGLVRVDRLDGARAIGPGFVVRPE
jgi:hypothetical protein